MPFTTLQNMSEIATIWMHDFCNTSTHFETLTSDYKKTETNHDLKHTVCQVYKAPTHLQCDIKAKLLAPAAKIACSTRRWVKLSLRNRLMRRSCWRACASNIAAFTTFPLLCTVFAAPLRYDGAQIHNVDVLYAAARGHRCKQNMDDGRKSCQLPYEESHVHSWSCYSHFKLLAVFCALNL
jgi:hypothetical protein